MDWPDPIHEEGEDDDVDHAELVDEELWVVEEGDADQRPRGDGQTQQVDRRIQVLLFSMYNKILQYMLTSAPPWWSLDPAGR